ncbi:MAG: CoA-binding protein [Dehalococcoidia bacterium]|nr:CoA-binding protein [Dehalococcoidia bacterium]
MSEFTTPIAEALPIIEAARSIAVVGISSRPDRPSYEVAEYLIGGGYEVYLVNPAEAGPILGRPVYPSLAALPEPVDIVDVFRRPEFVPGVVEDAIAAQARAVWLQLEIVHPEAAERARAAGLHVVMDRCTKIDHEELLRRRRVSP